MVPGCADSALTFQPEGAYTLEVLANNKYVFHRVGGPRTVVEFRVAPGDFTSHQFSPRRLVPVKPATMPSHTPAPATRPADPPAPVTVPTSTAALACLPGMYADFAFPLWPTPPAFGGLPDLRYMQPAPSFFPAYATYQPYVPMLPPSLAFPAAESASTTPTSTATSSSTAEAATTTSTAIPEPHPDNTDAVVALLSMRDAAGTPDRTAPSSLSAQGHRFSPY